MVEFVNELALALCIGFWKYKVEVEWAYIMTWTSNSNKAKLELWTSEPSDFGPTLSFLCFLNGLWMSLCKTGTVLLHIKN